MSRTVRMSAVAVLVTLTPTGAAHGSDALSLPSAPLPYMVGGQTTVVWQYPNVCHPSVYGATTTLP